MMKLLIASLAAVHAFAPGTVPTPSLGKARPSLLVANALVATPPDGFDGAVAAGTKKASLPASKIFGLGILSGCHISFGAFLMLSVGGACPGLAATNPGLQKIILGAFGLPFGLFMTLMTGAELFTGNTALVSMAAYEGEATTDQVAKSWVMSYLGNFVGSVGLAFLVSAGAKTSLPFMKAFVRGILCNWLVCMGVYMASMAKDVAGKMVAIRFPISAFVTLGLEHSVANMFIIPLGIFSGAAVSWKTFFMANLLPVPLGNIVGGAVAVAAVFSFMYGKLGK